MDSAFCCPDNMEIMGLLCKSHFSPNVEDNYPVFMSHRVSKLSELPCRCQSFKGMVQVISDKTLAVVKY